MNESSLNKEYLVAILLEAKKLGEQFLRWPHHVTLIPGWLRLDRPEWLTSLLKPAAAMPPFKVLATEKTYFGGRSNIPVTLVESPELDQLHKTILEALSSNFRFRPSDFNWKPHVTKKQGVWLEPGTSFWVDRFYIVEAPVGDRLNRIKTLVGEVKLQNEET